MPGTSSLAADGYCTLPDVLSAQRASALVAEAAAFAPNARPMPRDEYRVKAAGRIASPRRMSAIAAGPVLRAIQRDEQLLDLLERTAGKRLTPTNGAYIYYEPGDYLGLHKDEAVCEVTLITGVADALGPLVVHPPLVDVPAQELLKISRAHAATPPGGVEVDVPGVGSFLMLLGSKVPHHRPRSRTSCAIATLCFG